MTLKAVSVALLLLLVAGAPAAGGLLPSPQAAPGPLSAGALLGDIPFEAPPFFREAGALIEGAAWGPLARASIVPGVQYVPRPPIVIDSEDDFTLANGVVGGSGTASDPYVISGWEIDGHAYVTKTPFGTLRVTFFLAGILIRDTLSHVRITGNHVHGMGLAAVAAVNAQNVVVDQNLLVMDNPNGDLAEGLVAGVLFTGTKDSAVTGNRIHSEGSSFATPIVGAYFNLARDVRVAGNVFTNNATATSLYVGLYDAGSVRLTVAGNTVANQAVVGSFLGEFHHQTTLLTVDGNTVRNDRPGPLSQGLMVRSSTFSLVRDNNLSAGKSGGTAAWMLQDTGLNLQGNLVHGSTFGLVVQQSPGAVMRGANVTGNTYGFGLYGVTLADFAFDGNHSSNRVNGKPLVYLTEGPFDRWMSNHTVDAASFNPGWFGIYQAANVTVVNLSVTGNLQGALLVGLRSSRVVNATGAGNLRGLELALSNNTTIERYQGPYLMLVGSRLNLVENSTFTAPGVFNSYGARLVLNSNGNRFRHNAFQGLTTGVAINGSTTNNFTLNRFDGNRDASVLLEGVDAGGNVLYHNNLVNGIIYQLRSDGAHVTANENHWGHAGAPTRTTSLAFRADIAAIKGAVVLANNPSDTPYPSAGPIP